jgi:hypothetical protein
VTMRFLPMSQGPPFSNDLWNLRELIGPVQRNYNQLSHLPQLTFIHSSNPTSLNTAPTVQCGLGKKSLDISVAGSPSWVLLLLCLLTSSLHHFLPHHLDGIPLPSLPSRVLGSFQLQSPPHYGLPSHAGKHEIRCLPHLM